MVTKEEVQKAFDFHVEQLKRSGATIQDCVCDTLRRIIEEGYADNPELNK